eukprot:9254627-Pyramimonas_sp.AAC.1
MDDPYSTTRRRDDSYSTIRRSDNDDRLAAAPTALSSGAGATGRDAWAGRMDDGQWRKREIRKGLGKTKVAEKRVRKLPSLPSVLTIP